MTEYGKPQQSTTIANISRSPNRPVEQATRNGPIARLPHAQPKAPVAVVPASVSKPAAAISKEMTPMRRDLEARAKALANRPPMVVGLRPVSIGKAELDEDCGPGRPRPGGVKVR